MSGVRGMYVGLGKCKVGNRGCRELDRGYGIVCKIGKKESSMNASEMWEM